MIPLLLACVAAPPSPPAAGTPRFGDPATRLVYEIYVPSFQDSDGDGVGDLDGVRGRLDYLGALGVTDVWLMPLGEAADLAGWDPIEPAAPLDRLGGADGLHHLVVEAHDRGMRVTVTVPADHLSAESPAFAAAEADPGAPERAWFRFASVPGVGAWYPAVGGGWYAAAGGAERPDLDGDGDAALALVAEWVDAWEDLGVDGVRLDRLERLLPAPEEADRYAGGPELTADVHEDAVAWHAAGVTLVGDPARGAALRAALTGRGAEGVTRRVEEAADQGLGGSTTAGLTPSRGPRLPTLVPDARLRRAGLVATYLMPGVPRLYYGEELDLPDARDGGEARSLAPMPWDTTRAAGFSTARPWMEPDDRYLSGQNVADELDDPQSPLRLARALADLRAESVAARSGDWASVASDTPGVLAWTRSTRDEALLVVLNLGPPTTPAVDAPGAWTDVTGGRAPATCAPTCPVGELPTGGYRVYTRGVPSPPAVPR